MKLIQLITQRASRKILPFALCFLSIQVFSQSRKETDAGAILSAEINKSFKKRFDLTFAEEVRFITNTIGFERSVTTLGIDYTLWKKKLKMGVYYDFIYHYNKNRLFEARNRYYYNLSYKQAFESFTLTWRGRIQGTYRDENRDSYKINPKYVLKNRLQLEYSIFGKPWKPSVSCEISNELNNPMGNKVIRMRYEGGVTWRMNRTEYLDFFIRYGRQFDFRDSHVFYIGTGYKLKM